MALNTPDSSHHSPGWREFVWALLVLVAILGYLFHQSFSPAFVLFNNDAPLGALSVQEEFAAGQFTGAWYTSNWVGTRGISALPTISSLFYLLTGAVGFSKFYPPFCFLLLGLSVWWLFKRLGFGWVACLLGAIAAALNMNSFSNGCWGLPTRALSMATTFCALGFIYGADGRYGWLRLLLAGAFLGIGLMEAYDVGAIYSIYAAVFLLFCTMARSTARPAARIMKSFAAISLVATFAALVAAHALSTLIATQIKGVARAGGAGQSARQTWDSATAWSLPKIETLRVLIPGLYGYRMDSPSGAQYWGNVGRTPGWEQHHQGYQRHSGSGEYAGLLVVLIAVWGMVEGFGRGLTALRPLERRMVQFWAVIAGVSLLLAFGRYAPFYKIVYSIPALSFIRNPIKFMHPFHLSLLILFGYGMEALARRYLELKPAKSTRLDFPAWWAAAKPFEKKWVWALGAAVAAVLLSFLLYYSSQRELQAHLVKEGFSEGLAIETASFSRGELGWFLFFLALGAALLVLLMKGAFTEGRLKWAAVLMGVVLAIDLCRANAPWIIYYNYRDKYATNPVIELLRQQPYDHRVTTEAAPLTRSPLTTEPPERSILPGLNAEWVQHLFQYFRVQTLDIVQSPRTPEMDSAFMAAFRPVNRPLSLCSRLWELTNTRYLLGTTEFLGILNNQFDPGKQRFGIAASFHLAPKPTVPEPKQLEDLMVVPDPAGRFSLFEFKGALPRARLYDRWMVMTNAEQALATLSETNFEPAQVVLVNTPLPQPASPASPTNAGTVSIQVYQPKEVVLQAQAAAPAVLLLNDRYDDNWRVKVDGVSQTVLRCNYLMRGVYLPPGNHTVVFNFSPPALSLYLSLAGLAGALGIAIFLSVAPEGPPPPPPPPGRPPPEKK